MNPGRRSASRRAHLWSAACLAMMMACSPAVRTARAQTLNVTVTPAPLYTAQEEAELDARLHDDIDSLSVDHVRGVYRSRHARRVDALVDAVPFLQRSLTGRGGARTRFLPEASQSGSISSGLDCFRADPSDTFPLAICNLSATLTQFPPAPHRPRPKVILCSHYDSDGRLSGRSWRFERDPAPGADDAASGCAAVLELAREATALELPFDLEFVLFGGEEFGMLGSLHEAAQARGRGDSILGVINLDQLAYAPRLDSLCVVSDSASAWLADSLVSVSHRAWRDGPPLGRVVEALPNADSDHYPYQRQGYPAVMLIEAPNPAIFNPTIETMADTLGNLSMRPIRRAVQLVGLWLRELSRPRVAFAPDAWPLAGLGCGTSAVPVKGDTLWIPPVRARLIAGPSAPVRWRIEDIFVPVRAVEGSADGRLYCPIKSEFQVTARSDGAMSAGAAPGSLLSLPARSVPLRRDLEGFRMLRESWTPDPAAVDASPGYDRNGWSAVLDVVRPHETAWDAGPDVNPAFPSLPRVTGRVALAAGTPVSIEIVDGSGRLVRSATERVEPWSGLGRITLLEQSRIARVPSGVYFYHLSLADGRQARGRFMVLK